MPFRDTFHEKGMFWWELTMDGYVAPGVLYSDTPLAIAVGVDTMLYSHIPNVTKTVLSCVFPFKQFAD